MSAAIVSCENRNSRKSPLPAVAVGGDRMAATSTAIPTGFLQLYGYNKKGVLSLGFRVTIIRRPFVFSMFVTEYYPY